MAIRGPKPEVVREQAGARPVREQAASPLQRLMDFGAARTPQEAQKLIKELLATLRAAGFPVSAAGSPENQLGSALKLFQESRGLPPNGRLDEKTRDALIDAGHLPQPAKSDAAGGGGVGQKRDAPQVDLRPRADPKLGVGELSMRAPTGSEARPDGAKSSQGVELSQLSERVARDKPPEVDLKSFLSSLRAAGFQGQGKGAEQLKDSLKRLQKAEGLPQSGQLDARTAAALVRRGIIDERVLPMTLANAQNASDAQLARSDSKRESEARADVKDARQDPSTRGTRETADAEASKGRGDVDGRDGASGAKGGEGDARDAASTSRAGTAQAAEGQQGTGDVNDPWREGVEGNAPAGDDDVDDERRGRANVEDTALEEDEEGYWQVEPLSVQIEAGLASIARDDDGTGAATYAWDFTLYRPGVYGAKQPAEKLFHLVVTKASPFDPLWEQAREALNDKLALLEPEAKRITIDDVTRTLRVARMKT
jgi:hypothetical protein